MKYFNRIWLGAFALSVVVSCADDTMREFVVEMPESLAKMEYLNDYDVLKSCIDHNTNPGFKLGAGVSAGDFTEQGLVCSLISSNFDEMSAGWEMKHGAVVQSDGSFNFSRVESFVAAAQEAGITIYGHTLCWHANQNAEYLNKTIAPIMVVNPGGGGSQTLDPSVITNTDFENGDGGWIGWGDGSTRGVSADGEGYDGTGYAYTFTNTSVVNYWEAQVAFDFPALQIESTYVLNFKVKASVSGSIRAEIQSTADYSSDGFGVFAISGDWEEYTLETVATKEDRNRFVISFGDYAGTVYMDDITLCRVNPTGGGDQVIEKTPEEKRDTITTELERWISGMMEVSNGYVKAWDVVNEPMDDGNPYELKTGEGRDLADDEFYWQDYLGKDYAVIAFRLARQYGNTGDKLFINDYNLEYNLDKCRGLIAYVEYIESQGAQVDGIGTQMHISIDSDKEKIAEMFSLLAATGKLIKISELDIGVGVKTSEATEDDYITQAEMYKYVVEKYFELIPAQQRYGITVWSPFDSPEGSSWRAGEPIGLWTENYNRKRAYGGFADGLLNN